jgi:hypothetical protein
MPDEMNEPIASDLRLSAAHRLLPTDLAITKGKLDFGPWEQISMASSMERGRSSVGENYWRVIVLKPRSMRRARKQMAVGALCHS